MVKFKVLKAALLAASACTFAAPVVAQPVTPAEAEQAENDFHASMEAEAAQPVDPNATRLSLPEPAEVWLDHRVQLEAGRRYRITVSSEAFDPVARIMRAGSTEPLAQDDDSGGGTTARMIFTAPATGDYVVQVKSFTPGGSGEFAVSTVVQSPLPALVSSGARTERGNWQVYSGNLGASSATDGGRKYADYSLRLAANEVAMLHVLGAGDLDTVLQVFTASERGLTPIVENDDGGGAVNPFLFFVPSEAGDYVVRVIGFDEQSAGAYRLRIAKQVVPNSSPDILVPPPIVARPMTTTTTIPVQ